MASGICVEMFNSIYFDPDGIWPRPGDYVIVETARGVEFGEVVTGSRSVNDAQIVAPLKKVIRVASEEDIQRAENNEKREREAFGICQERIARHKLDMKLTIITSYPSSMNLWQIAFPIPFAPPVITTFFFVI